MEIPLPSQLKKRGTQALEQAEAAEEILSIAMARLAKEYPPGCLPWADAHRPDLAVAFDQARAAVEAAFKEKDFTGALAAVREFEEKSFDLFRAYQEAIEGGTAGERPGNLPNTGQSDSRRLEDLPPVEVDALMFRYFTARLVRAGVNTIDGDKPRGRPTQGAAHRTRRVDGVRQTKIEEVI